MLDQLEIMLPQPNLSWDWAELGKKYPPPLKFFVRQGKVISRAVFIPELHRIIRLFGIRE